MAAMDRSFETLSARARGRRLVLAVALLAGVFLVARATEASDQGPAPDFALKSVAGRNIRLSEYRSEVVALTFVASWCGSCRNDMAELRQLQQSFGPDGLSVIAVSFDKDAAIAAPITVGAGGAFPVLLDPDGEAGRLYAIGRLPALVLVDRGGRLRREYRNGEMASQAELAREIRTLLAE